MDLIDDEILATLFFDEVPRVNERDESDACDASDTSDTINGIDASDASDASNTSDASDAISTAILSDELLVAQVKHVIGATRSRKRKRSPAEVREAHRIVERSRTRRVNEAMSKLRELVHCKKKDKISVLNAVIVALRSSTVTPSI